MTEFTDKDDLTTSFNNHFLYFYFKSILFISPRIPKVALRLEKIMVTWSDSTG